MTVELLIYDVYTGLLTNIYSKLVR